MFQEEKNRKKWCCSANSANVLDLPPLNQPFYANAHFLEHNMQYNQLFAFSALIIPGYQTHPDHGLSFIKIMGRTYKKVYDLSYNGKQVNTSRLYIDDVNERRRVEQEMKLNDQVIREIEAYLSQCNPYAELYRQIRRECQSCF